MASATFDTLHAAKALTAAGFESQQAEAITDTIRDAFTESVATKADIAEVKAENRRVEGRIESRHRGHIQAALAGSAGHRDGRSGDRETTVGRTGSMATATFDTLHAAKALTAAGFEAQQAEAITDTIRDAFTESVATKADIAELRADMASLETRLVERIDAVETRVAERFEALYKQLWLMALGIVTAVAAIVKLL